MSVTDINHMLQVFEDCLTVIFSSALLLFHDSPVCKAGERIRYIYDGEKALYERFTSFAQLNTETGHTPDNSEKKKKPTDIRTTVDKCRQ